MTSSTPNRFAVDEEALDPVLASIRKVEAIRDFASDITPLRSDGFNLHSWVGEIDKTLSDLIDRERYLRGSSLEPFVNSEDKIARNLIYWTIPRELRSLINDAPTARDAFKALQAQFSRNTRVSHMAALVDLFNFQMDVTEPQHITMLYDQMYKGMNELVSSGFVINEDSLLGALFQIAVGRANSQLYAATSHLLDTKFGNELNSISSHEVCAAARRQLEHWHSTIFDEDPIMPSSEMINSLEPPAEEASVNLPHSTIGASRNALPTTNSVNQQQPLEHPSVLMQPQPYPASGSSHTCVEPAVDKSIPPPESSTSVNKATSSAPQVNQTVDPPLTRQLSPSSNTNLAGKSDQTADAKAAAALFPSLCGNRPTAFDPNSTSLFNPSQTSNPNATIFPPKHASSITNGAKSNNSGKPAPSKSAHPTFGGPTPSNKHDSKHF